jgi:hypothetical protein
MDATTTRSEAIQKQAEAHVDGLLAMLHRALDGVWGFFRFLLFLIYLLFAVLSFWLWATSMLFLFIRLALHATMTVLLWLSGGLVSSTGERLSFDKATADIELWWRRRHGSYSVFVHPVASHAAMMRRSTQRFWHWSLPRKLVGLMAAAAFIALPGLWVVPRPHYVQIVDDNVIDHHQGQVRYLVHGVDMFKPGQTREYQNERAVWLGKINPQGIKNRLVVGRFYRLWVIGVRWYWVPTLFPNIIGVTEVDGEGNTLTTPSHLIPAATTGRSG